MDNTINVTIGDLMQIHSHKLQRIQNIGDLNYEIAKLKKKFLLLDFEEYYKDYYDAIGIPEGIYSRISKLKKI